MARTFDLSEGSSKSNRRDSTPSKIRRPTPIRTRPNEEIPRTGSIQNLIKQYSPGHSLNNSMAPSEASSSMKSEPINLGPKSFSKRAVKTTLEESKRIADQYRTEAKLKLEAKIKIETEARIAESIRIENEIKRMSEAHLLDIEEDKKLHTELTILEEEMKVAERIQHELELAHVPVEGKYEMPTCNVIQTNRPQLRTVVAVLLFKRGVYCGSHGAVQVVLKCRDRPRGRSDHLGLTLPSRL